MDECECQEYYDEGYEDGYDRGLGEGYEEAKGDIYNYVREEGFQEGYQQGREEVEDEFKYKIEQFYEEGYKDGQEEPSYSWRKSIQRNVLALFPSVRQVYENISFSTRDGAKLPYSFDMLSFEQQRLFFDLVESARDLLEISQVY